MADQITNYQCPACTGPLHFVGESGMLECDYCESKFSVEEIEAFYAEKDKKAEEAFNKEEEKRETRQKKADSKKSATKKETGASSKKTEEESEWDYSNLNTEWGSDAEGMRAYSCPSCGAELMCDSTTAATSCPYCGNPTIVPGQFSGTLKPDLIIPFKLDKKAAVAALKNHYRRKWLLPKAFSDTNHIEEMQGVYVPFWLFDTTAKGNVVFRGTRSHSHREGDYEVTETEHWHADRSGVMDFENIPTDASSKMADDYMDSIEPFNYSELKPFSTAYLPGYLADRYDVTARETTERVEKRCRETITDHLRQDVKGYESVTVDSKRINLKQGNVKYALLPVWTLRTKWNDKEYLFMMNGQTGKMVGDLPISPTKYRIFFWVTTVIASGALIALRGGARIALLIQWILS